MKNKNKAELILQQLTLIEDTNKIIDYHKEKDGINSLMTRQYQHLNGKFIVNLHKMLLEYYNIPLPNLEKSST